METIKLDHLNLSSADGTQLNMDALYRIAPSVFTEALDPKTGKVARKVDFDALRQLLGDNAVEADSESYRFTWVGKNAAKAEAARPTDKTLRPVVEDSVDWDNTKNIYIEGDKVVTATASKMLLRVLFRDSCFTQDAQKINIYEQFKQAMDWTDDEAFKNIKVI